MKELLLKLLDVLIPSRWYILHTEANVIWSNDNYFGPFRKRELELRLTDEYAELLRYGGDLVGPVKLSWLEARELFIQSRDWWLEQEDALSDDEPPLWRQDH